MLTSMAKGGEWLEVRKNIVISGIGSDIGAMATEEKLPEVADVGTNQHRSIEKALGRFATQAASSTNPPSIPPELESVLREIAVVGVPYYGWGGLKELLAARMIEVVTALERDAGYVRAAGAKDFRQRRDELVASLRRFDAAPFTLQRLAEILQNPRRQYSTTHKLINGLQRLLSVSSTLDTAPRKGAAPPRPPLPPTPAATSATAGGTATATATAAVPSSRGATASSAGAAPTVTTATSTATATAARTTTTATTTTTMTATATSTVMMHDVASNGASRTTTAAGQDPTSVVAVKVEEQRGGEVERSGGSNSPVDGEPIARAGGGHSWDVESNGKRGPGWKRLKVDVKSEAPAMTE